MGGDGPLYPIRRSLMTSELIKLPATALIEGYQRKDFSPSEVMDAVIARLGLPRAFHRIGKGGAGGQHKACGECHQFHLCLLPQSGTKTLTRACKSDQD